MVSCGARSPTAAGTTIEHMAKTYQTNVVRKPRMMRRSRILRAKYYSIRTEEVIWDGQAIILFKESDLRNGCHEVARSCRRSRHGQVSPQANHLTAHSSSSTGPSQQVLVMGRSSGERKKERGCATRRSAARAQQFGEWSWSWACCSREGLDPGMLRSGEDIDFGYARSPFGTAKAEDG